MSTITTINATDVVADSRAVINTNFSNLNTDKAEKSNNLSDLTNAATARTNLGVPSSSAATDEAIAMAIALG